MPLDYLHTLCQHHNALVLNIDDATVHVAVAGEPSNELMDALRFSTHRHIDIECWSAERLEKERQLAAEPLRPAAQDESASVVGLIDQTLQQALQRRASDIHFEPAEAHYQIRFRIDGVLHPLPPLPAALASALTARLKVLGNLDIAERRLPQDGQFSIELGGRTVSFRISTLLCRCGEKVVLRLLQQTEQPLEVQALGLSPAQQTLFCQALQRPQGLILVTGPTGSGKTVTLYTALSTLNEPQVNICSVEDPVEIPVTGLNQTPVLPKAGLTFQAVLRALLRQDPDVIMIGEIRDLETAEIAVKAAQTGHLVLSTLHTNSTTETLVRLEQMGLPRWMLASALELVVAQRLVRKLCPYCRVFSQEPVTLPASLWPRPIHPYKACGCERCYGGYYGRIALFELLSINTALRQTIASGAPPEEIASQARVQGMTTLFEHGLQAIGAGLTTPEELYRVSGMPHG